MLGADIGDSPFQVTSSGSNQNEEMSDAEFFEQIAEDSSNPLWSDLMEQNADFERKLENGEFEGMDDIIEHGQKQDKEIEEEHGWNPGEDLQEADNSVSGNPFENGIENINNQVDSIIGGVQDGIESVQESGEQMGENIQNGTENAGKGFMNWLKDVSGSNSSNSNKEKANSSKDIILFSAGATGLAGVLYYYFEEVR